LKHTSKYFKLIAIILFGIVYSIFYLYKASKYDLFYYKHDLFSVLSSSRGWVFGHPILWDNRYGFIPAVHFSFTSFFFSPLTILLGGRGLFIIHAVIYFIAYSFAVCYTLTQKQLKMTLPLLFIFFLSPYAIWLFDDTLYGWHTELLFLPFALLFAIGLITKNKLLLCSSALFLILTKEDGGVIACCIHILFILSGNNTRKVKQMEIIKIISFWLSIFIFSIITIKAFNSFRESRIENLFANFIINLSNYNVGYFVRILFWFFILILPAYLFCFLLLGSRKFLTLFLCTLPLILTSIVSGLFYAADNEWYGLGWAPRVVGILGVMLSGSYIFLYQKEFNSILFQSKLKSISIVTIIIVLQFFSLLKARDYNLITEVKKAYNHTLPEGITPYDANIMKTIAGHTPSDFTVTVPYYYFNLFDKNDFTWFDHPENAYSKSDIIIMEDTLQYHYIFNDEIYKRCKKGKFYILIKKDKLNNYPDF
jgi:hypothetical protein